MPFSSVHTLLRIEGSFGSSAAIRDEEWICTMRINTGPTVTGEAQKVAFLETASVPIQTFHTNVGTAAGASCWLQALSAAYINTDGNYLGGGSQTTTTRPYTTPQAGSGGTGVSWDVARVYTLRTAQPRGRGHVGRFFYPCQEQIATDGRWSSTQANTAANLAKTMIEQVNAAAKSQWPASFGISVMSFVGGVSYQVNAVEVGRAPDTQRRRTKQLEEAPARALISGLLTSAEVAQSRVYS